MYCHARLCAPGGLLLVSEPRENWGMRESFTPEMLTTLDHMAAGEDRALVRAFGPWWVRESDAGGPWAPSVTLQGKLLFSGHGEPVKMIRDTTVQALVRRGVLSLVGPVRTGNRYRAKARAELT